ncbi:fructan 6-exohydrolase, partial [Tanacetum coccineum]
MRVKSDVEISYRRIDSESISEDIKQLEYVSDFDGDSLRASSCSELQEECRVFFECGVYFFIDYNVCKFLAMQANMKIRAIAQDCSEYSITVAVEKKDYIALGSNLVVKGVKKRVKLETSSSTERWVDTSVISPRDRVKHVLRFGLVHHAKDYYMIGSYNLEKENYEPEYELMDSTLRFNFGKYYGSKSFFNPVKNMTLMAWVNESDFEDDAIAKGWAGIQSFVRTLWLDENQTQLIQWPIEEIEMLHENEADLKISFKLTNLEEAEEPDPRWIDPRLICSEMDASKKGKFGPFGLLDLASDELAEQTAIFFSIFQNNGRYVVLMCCDQRLLWKAMSIDIRHITPKVLPNMVSEVDLLEGDEGYGSMLLFKFCPYVPKVTFQREKIVEFDELVHYIALEILEGGHLDHGFLKYTTA